MRVEITSSNMKEKRLKAVFYDGDKKIKTTHFGLKGGSTFIEHQNERKKQAYIARHKVNENCNDFKSAGSLARWILWNKPTITSSITDYKNRFGLK